MQTVYPPATTPISAVSLPLPANAAQEAGGHLAACDSFLNFLTGNANFDLSNVMDACQFPVGVHANAWDNVAVGAGGTSTAIDCQYQGIISAFGHVSGATTITLQYSQDNSNFYDAGSSVTIGAADFFIDVRTGARYMRLKSSGAVTITATIAGKR